MKDYGDVIEDVSDLDIMQHALEGTTDTLQKTEKYMPFRYTWKVMDSLLISRCLRMLEFL